MELCTFICYNTEIFKQREYKLQKYGIVPKLIIDRVNNTSKADRMEKMAFGMQNYDYILLQYTIISQVTAYICDFEKKILFYED